MKQSLKTILTLFFVLCTFVLTESLHAWWSQPNNMHFRLLNLSQSKLLEIGLFNMALEKASGCPDGPNKSLVHKDPGRVKLNFCAAVGMALKGDPHGPVNCRHDCQSIADCMGRTLHYLDDNIDSTHIDSEHVMNDLRHHAYNRFNEIKMNPRLGQYIMDYNSIISNKSFINDIHKETSRLRAELRTANNIKDINTRTTERDEVFAKNFALIKASQDRLIDLYIEEVKAYASNTCKDTPAYCIGLEEKIRQVCLVKDVNSGKRLLNEAKAAYCNIPQNAYQGCAATTPATPVAPPKPPPPKNIVSEQEKKVLYDEIYRVYKTKWEKHWCAKGWSGCAIVPSDQKDTLKWAVVNSSRREQLEAIRKRLYCYDPCIMGNYNDKQRTDCLQRCIKQFPN